MAILTAVRAVICVTCGGGGRMECGFLKPDGKKCVAQTISNDVFCFAHSRLPEIIEKRLAAKILGGKNGRKKMLEPIESEVIVENPKDVVILLTQTINDVRMKRINTTQANCIGFLCNAMINALDNRQKVKSEGKKLTFEELAKRLEPNRKLPA